MGWGTAAPKGANGGSPEPWRVANGEGFELLESPGVDRATSIADRGMWKRVGRIGESPHSRSFGLDSSTRFDGGGGHA